MPSFKTIFLLFDLPPLASGCLNSPRIQPLLNLIGYGLANDHEAMMLAHFAMSGQ